MANCPVPAGISPCPPTRVYSVGGVDYIALLRCDNNGEILVVFELCSGVPSGAPSYFDPLTGAVKVPVGVLRDCSSGFDFEQLVFCDTGTIPSTPFISRVRWDENGDLIADATGTFTLDGLTPYTPLGAVVLCDSGALPPQDFCFKSSVTAPQDFPGRRFTGALPLAIGYTVSSVLISGVSYPLGITWQVTDPTAAIFMPALAAAIQGKIPGSTVTAVPATPIDACAGVPQPFLITVDCIKATDAPNDITFVYDGGNDLILNAAFNNSSPPAPGTINFHKRQDAGGDIFCTNTANKGWETNDPTQDFEMWGVGFSGTTPTPRGTAIQEMNCNARDTLWQTFTTALGGTFTIRATVGGRGKTDIIGITLSTGDTNAAGPGDVINASITAPSVNTELAPTFGPGGVAGPWTNFTQVVSLLPGTYTLALVGPTLTSPGNFTGGLFTDLRVFTTVPNQTLSLTPDDTCTITENVTTNTTSCQIWQPLLGSGGAIVSWSNPKTGQVLSNAGFWAQVPAPECCTSEAAASGDITAPNLEDSYLVCGTVAGIQVPLIRQLILDQNGGAISETFITVDGVPVTPTTWTPGDCERGFQTEILCDDNGPFLRRYVRDAEGNVTSLDLALDGSSVYVPVGTPKVCGASSLVIGEMCYGPATLTMALTPVTVVGADEGPQVVTFNNGSGVTATITTALGQANTYNVPVLGTALPNTAVNAPTTIDLGTCRTGVVINFAAFDNPSTGANERLRNISPAPSRITGEGVLVGSNGVDSTTGPGPGKNFQLYWDQGVRTISFDFLSAGHAVESIVFVNSLTIDNPARVAVVLCDGCDGGIKYYDTLTGAEVVAPVLRECPDECSGVASGNTLIKACDTVTGAGTPATCASGTPISFIAPDAQDAEQKNPTTGGNAVNVNDNDLEIAGIAEVGETDYMIAVRFNAPIPQGATVCSAYVQFTAEGNTSTGVMDITINGENVDSSAPFTTAANSVVPRVRTAAQTAWNNVPLWTNNAAGAAQQTPSLVTIVQEIVNRPGWVSGNPLALFFTPGATGYRRASSIQDGSEAPQLHVTYVTGAGVSTTVCTPFYMEVDGSGVPTGDGFFIDPADETWKPYTVQGDVTLGACECGDTPSSSVDYEAFCYEDSLGIRFTRLFRITANGPELIGDYALNFSGNYTPIGAVAACSTVEREGEPLVMCDANDTAFLRHIIYTNEGLLDVPYDTALDGVTFFAPVLPVKVCGGAGTPGSASILADCADVGNAELIYGPNLLTNGDFQQSTGTGVTSAPGAGWTTGYTPVNDIFAAGAQTYGFFTTNAGAVTGGNPAATPILALTGRSMAVNVGPNLALAIISWANIYLENGASYAFEGDVAIIFNPFGVGIRVDGVQIVAMTAPIATGVWEKTKTTFTWTGTTGYHTVSLNSNSGVAGGNDHTFDNLSLRQSIALQAETRTSQPYESRVLAVVDQIVETTGCKDDRRDELLAIIAKNSALGSFETIVCAAGVSLIRRVAFDGSITFIGSNGAVVAAPAVFTIGACASTSTDLEAVDFCLRANTAGAGYALGDQIKLTRWFNPATNTQVSEVAFNMTQGGSAVTVPLTAANFDACAESTVVVEEGCLQTTVSPTLIAPTFFTPFPDPSAGATNPSWARSADAGITYVANPADSTSEVVGPRGQVRFRQVITIPSIYSGTFAVTVSGDIFNGASNDPAEVFYDGVTQGTIIPLAGPVTKTLPVVPGLHYFDIWIGASGTAGLTAPVVTVSYTNVTEILPGTATSIEIVKTISPTGVITVKYHDAAGVEIIPPVGSTISVGRCLKASSTEILCDSVGSFLRRYGEEAGDYTLDGLSRYTPVGAVDVCKCSEIQPTIDSTLQSLVGATTVTIPIGARSVSLAVVTGTVSVVIGAAAAVVVPAGSSFTWSVNEGGPAGETLAKAHVFTGIVGTTAFVTTTREI